MELFQQTQHTLTHQTQNDMRYNILFSDMGIYKEKPLSATFVQPLLALSTSATSASSTFS